MATQNPVKITNRINCRMSSRSPASSPHIPQVTDRRKTLLPLEFQFFYHASTGPALALFALSGTLPFLKSTFKGEIGNLSLWKIDQSYFSYPRC